ncbi:uncharacterized protein LOC133203556 [Saccostrea echinata]|uniref:uncharacterized protein LOC133203556 n=1 Tax=Saccostrea echinata TaxID=191078 RepID=UPI002A81AF27|nr:uncharacterized protein LOC133203556 [Saccostrea echinata]
MQKCFLISLVFSGILEFVKCDTPISTDQIEKLIVKRFEEMIKNYDNKIVLLEEKVHSQQEKIKNLELNCIDKMSNNDEEGRKDFRKYREPNHSRDDHNEVMSNTRSHGKSEQKSVNNFEARKRIVPVPDSSSIVAFCAYMSSKEISPSLHHVFVFDVVKTNIGSAYNRNSGIFTVPMDGTYVFTWSVFSDFNSYITSQIVINSQAFANMITDSEEIRDIHSTTGVIVAALNHGDLVYVRTHPTDLSHGNVLSHSVYGRPSFSGWKL